METMRVLAYKIYIKGNDIEIENIKTVLVEMRMIVMKLEQAFGDDLIDYEFEGSHYERTPDEGEIHG